MSNRTAQWNSTSTPSQFTERRDRTGDSAFSVSNNQTPQTEGRFPYTNDSFNKWMPYFGMPSKPYMMPYQDHDVQHETLPQAYEGDCILLRDMQITQLKDSDEWTYKVLAPLVLMEKSMTFTMDRIIFNDHMLDRVPEEGIGRLTTHRKESKRDHMNRYGMSLLLNTQHLGTPMGDQMYTMQLKQMFNANSETVSHGVIWHVLNHTPYEDDSVKYRTGEAGYSAIDQLIKDELMGFACLPKEQYGGQMLIKRLDAAMTRRGQGVADMIVWPQGGEMYGGRADFYASGHQYENDKNHLVSQISRKMDHRTSRGFRVGNHSAVEDPQFRNRTIGGFNIINNLNISDVPMKDYTTSMLDRIIYSERLDGWVRITYEDSARYSGLYNWDDDDHNNPISPLGEEYFALYNANTWGQYLEKIDQLDAVVDKLYYDITKKIEGTNEQDPAFWELFKSAFKLTNIVQSTTNSFVHSVSTAVKSTMNSFTSNMGLAPAPEFSSGRISSGSSHTPAQNNKRSMNSSAAPVADIHSFGNSSNTHNNEGNALFASPFGGAPQPLTFSATAFTPVQPSQQQLQSQQQQQQQQLQSQQQQQQLQSQQQQPSRQQQPALVTPPVIPQQQQLPPPSASSNTTGNVNMTVIDSLRDVFGEINTLENPEQVKTPTLCDGFLFIPGSTSTENHIDFIREAKKSYPRVELYDKVKSLKLISCGKNKPPNEREPMLYFEASNNCPLLFLMSTQIPSEEPSNLYLNMLKYRDQVPKADLTQMQIKRLARFDLSLSISSIFYALKLVSFDQLLSESEIIDMIIPYFPLHHPVEGETFADLLRDWDLDEKDSEIPDVSWLNLTLNVQIPIAATIQTLVKAVHRYVLIRHYNSSEDVKDSTWEYFDKTDKESIQTLLAEVRRLTQVDNNGDLGTGQWPQLSMKHILAKLAVKTVDNEAAKKLKEQLVKLTLDYSYVDNLANTFRSYVQKISPPRNPSSREFNDLFSIYTEAFHQMYCFQMSKDVIKKDDGSTYLSAITNEHNLSTIILVIAFFYKFLTENITTYPVKSRLGLCGHIINSMIHGNSLVRGGDSAYNLFYFNLYGTGILNGKCQTFGDWQRVESQLNIVFKSIVVNLEKIKSDYESLDTKDAKEILQTSVNNTKYGLPSREAIKKMLLNDTEHFGVDKGAFWKFQIKNNGKQGIGMALVRPNQTYCMGSAIYIHSDGKCATTVIGHQVFRLGTDSARDLVFGNYTNYHKTIVTNNKNVIIARDILPRSYEGGNGHDFWDPLDDVNDVDDFHRSKMVRDIFSLAVPINYKPSNYYFDITGQHHESIEASVSVNNGLHYPSAALYRAHWRWMQCQVDPISKQYFTESSEANRSKFNTMVFQNVTFEYEWNSMSKGGGFTKVILEKGHWSQNVYEGCGEVRSGHKKFFSVPNYIQTKSMSLSV